MKFLAVLAESGSADALSRIIEFISKLCKDKVTLRMTSESVSLISAGSLISDGNYVQVTLNVREFFSTYVMGGVSEEFNEIYMDVEKDHLYRSLCSKDRSTKIRLVKLGNTPHLKVEQKLCGVIHEMPVELIPTKYWKTYNMPSLDNVQTAIYLPPLFIVRNLVTSFKNMGMTYMEMKGNQEGELHFYGDLDSGSIEAHFSDLANGSLDNASADCTDGPATLQSVRINIKTVSTFLRSLVTGFTMSRILLRIVPERMAIFSVEQDEAAVHFIVSGAV